jgi:hypothetical protein
LPTGTTGRYTEAGGEREDRLAGAGVAVEGDDADLGVEQEVERELLLLRSRTDAPALLVALQGSDDAVARLHEDRLLAGAQHGVLVGAEIGLGQVARVGRVEVVDDAGRHLDGAPTRRALADGEHTAAVVLAGLEPELRGLDAQGGVVGHDGHDGIGVLLRLAERSREDPVVGLGRVEPAGRYLVEVQAIGLDAERAAAGQLHGVADVAAVGDAQLLNGAHDLARRTADVVASRLQGVELLDDGEWDHRVGTREGEDRFGIRDEGGGVEHHQRRVAHLLPGRRFGGGDEDVGHWQLMVTVARGRVGDGRGRT